MSKNTSFIDQTFSVIATILVKILPSSDREKQAFNYYCATRNFIISL